MNILEEQYLLSGGDPSWLVKGLVGAESMPDKLKMLGELNEFMAFKPWMMTSDIIDTLVKGGKEKKD